MPPKSASPQAPLRGSIAALANHETPNLCCAGAPGPRKGREGHQEVFATTRAPVVLDPAVSLVAHGSDILDPAAVSSRLILPNIVPVDQLRRPRHITQ